MLQITDAQKTRVEKDWNGIAQEVLEYQYGDTVQDPIYAFGSELAVLRLFHKFAGGSAKAAYSKNLNKWYFLNK